jgi:hypothetical protein
MFGLGDEMKTDVVRQHDEDAKENVSRSRDVKKWEENLRLRPTGWHGTARHGTARHGTARHGTARYGLLPVARERGVRVSQRCTEQSSLV